MSNTKHTPEPWDATNWDGEVYITAGTNVAPGRVAVLKDRHAEIILHNAEANAARIVACVNACKGVPNEWLESNSVQARIDEVADLKREVEHYKAALERVAKQLQDSEQTELIEFINETLL